jgi:hypothetical protein
MEAHRCYGRARLGVVEGLAMPQKVRQPCIPFQPFPDSKNNIKLLPENGAWN